VNWVVLFEKVITVRAEVEIGKGSRERVSRWGQEEVKRVSAFCERFARRSGHERAVDPEEMDWSEYQRMGIRQEGRNERREREAWGQPGDGLGIAVLSDKMKQWSRLVCEGILNGSGDKEAPRRYVDKLDNLIDEAEVLAYRVLNGGGVRGNEELAYVFKGVVVTEGDLDQQHPEERVTMSCQIMGAQVK